jgi:hypothetical protein
MIHDNNDCETRRPKIKKKTTRVGKLISFASTSERKILRRIYGLIQEGGC